MTEADILYSKVHTVYVLPLTNSVWVGWEREHVEIQANSLGEATLKQQEIMRKVKEATGVVENN